MELVKKVGKTTIYKKRNGRFAVQGANKKWINGDEKAKILADAGLIKIAVKQEAPAEEAPAAEETAEETTEVQPEA